MKTDRAINSLRLTGKELEAILQRMDEGTRPAGSHSRRRTRRWPLVPQRTVLTITSSPSRSQHFTVIPRNISIEGMAVLHGGFLHTGTPFKLSLRDVTEKPVVLTGQIVRCQYIEKHLHEIGLRFDEPVDPRNFNIITGGEYVFNADHVSPKDLEGTVLIIGPRPFQAKLKSCFDGTEFEFSFSPNGKSALSMLDEKPSLVYVHEKLPDLDPLELIRTLRTKLRVHVVMLTDRDDKAVREAGLAAGASEVLAWPCTEEVMLRSAAEYLLLDDLLSMGRAMDEAALQPASERDEILERIGALGEEIARVMLEEQPDGAMAIVDRITECAKKLGEPVLVKRAAAAAQAVKESESQAADELGLLVRTCRRVAQNGGESEAAPDQARAAEVS